MSEVKTVSSSGGEKGTKDERYDLLPSMPMIFIRRVLSQVSFPLLDVNDTYSIILNATDLFWDNDLLSNDIEEDMTILANIGAIISLHFANEENIVTEEELEKALNSMVNDNSIIDMYYPYRIIPLITLEYLARHYGAGAKKYADHNWRKGYEISKNYAAFHRHLAEWRKGNLIDEETQSPHLIAALWHIFSMMHFLYEIENGRLPKEFDDRPRSQEKKGK